MRHISILNQPDNSLTHIQSHQNQVIRIANPSLD